MDQPVAGSVPSPLTWAAVAALVEEAPQGLSNQQIAAALEVDYHDVSFLTKLMWKAGQLQRDERSPRAKSGVAYVYRRA